MESTLETKLDQNILQLPAAIVSNTYACRISGKYDRIHEQQGINIFYQNSSPIYSMASSTALTICSGQYKQQQQA
jgi:hypothetical protein